MAVPWETINEKLPFQRNKVRVCEILFFKYVWYSLFSQDAYDKRKDMWTAMDVNGNGYLSLAEVTKVNFLEFFLSNALWQKADLFFAKNHNIWHLNRQIFLRIHY